MAEALRTHGPHVISVRVVRKSDQNYWTCNVRGFPTDLIGSVQQVQAWANGLAIHPNFECAYIEAINTAMPYNHFSHYVEILRKFLDGSD